MPWLTYYSKIVVLPELEISVNAAVADRFQPVLVWKNKKILDVSDGF